MNCIFCKIINKEIPAKIIYEDEYTLAFYDINPQVKIHIIVIPKKHIEDFYSIDDTNILNHIQTAIKKVVDILKVKETGFRVVTNNGKDATQSVFHVHFHVLAGEALSSKMA
jgi:histidine triad (HIT) family protein